MIRLHLARRRAEHFDSLVEARSPVPGGRDDVDPSTLELLELVGALRSAPEAQPRPEFVADLRGQLMLAAAAELKPIKATPRDDVARLTIKPRRSRRERRVGIALGAAAIIGATTSMAVASQSAIPGDALYPVKRAIENTQTGFSVGDDSKGHTILGNASTRLDEVDKLSKRGGSDETKLVKNTLADFSSQTTQAADNLMADFEQNGHEQSIEQIHQFATQSLDELAGLQGVIPPAAHDALVDAAQVVVVIDQAASNVCPDCGLGITELPSQLAAAGADVLNGLTGALAGGELPGTQPSTEPTDPAQPQSGGKGQGKPSGLNPPTNPISIPPVLPTETPGAGGLLPNQPTAGTSTGAGSGNGGNGHDGSNGGKDGGKGGKGTPVDLSPVTDTVNQVVTGVVEGVSGLLNGVTGLTGGLTGGLLGGSTASPGS